MVSWYEEPRLFVETGKVTIISEVGLLSYDVREQ